MRIITQNRKTYKNPSRNLFQSGIVSLLVLFSFFSTELIGQTINFGSSGLVGENLNNPTSLDFGPNQKLYVSQQDGTIWEYEIQRDNAIAGSGTYSIINSTAINIIKNSTPNHNDDGTSNPSNARQITGILAAGTPTNPILYVTSSDSRIGGGGGAGNDSNLDTNSGLLSRLFWNGSTWEKVDLVRGLPRCEENHSTNGLDIFTSGANTYLLIQQGGNTNQGAPSNNFAGTSEFYLSGALLIVNLTQLEQMEAANGGPYIDTRDGNAPYIYDLPTVNDPERQDIDNTHPSFPYGVSHPLYNATIDLGDPFGGNNGLNQAFSEVGAPVQIFSPGYRNAYDIVITENGRIYTGDNGSNGGWGGTPLIYDSNDVLKGTHYTTTYNPGAGDYITNEFNITNGRTHGDALHYVGTINDANSTYYGGHPAPIRAFPSKAGVYKYEYNGSDWVETASSIWPNLILGVSGYFNPSFDMTDFPDDPRQGEYLSDGLTNPKVNILDVVSSSTNGICEYTASNFNNAMQGNILTAAFNGNINRYELDASGNALVSKDNGFLSGFGNIPLDVIALGDNSPFPGTIWAATYGADNITVFEPVDFGECILPGETGYEPLADYDGDGFTNQDEIDNNTNHCSAGSSPNDNDGDFISDLNDTDDDNDGIADLQDAFAIDPNNGTTTNLPINYPFWNNDPGTGFFGLGFTGLMLDPSGTTDYLSQFDETNLSFGGAGGKATVDAILSGDALQAANTQENAFQFGVNVDNTSAPFTVHSKIETPFNGTQPLNGQSYGIFIGNGDQDNYLKVVIMDGITSGDGTNGFEVLLEDNGLSTGNTYNVNGLLQAGGVDIYISVNPQANTAQPFYSLNDGQDIFSLGNAISLPTSFLNAVDNLGMAVGLIGTSGTSNTEFTATWDFINITEDQTSDLVVNPSVLNFGTLNINGSPAQVNLEVTNVGGPAEGPIDITALNITGPDAALFNATATLPLTIGSGAEKLIPVSFTPDAGVGTKSASLEIVHSGANSPMTVSLGAVLSDPTIFEPLVRISVGGNATVAATDGGPNWESNPASGAYAGISYSVNSGNNVNSNFQYANRHGSIPAYIDQATFGALFQRERYDVSAAPEMEFTVPLTNGDYIVNIFLGNSFSGTDQIGERVFDILLEGNIVQDNMDMVAAFGHQAAAMVAYPVTVIDGELNIAFGHEIENPLLNAIEIIGGAVVGNQPPVAVASATPLSGEVPLEVTFTGSNSTDDVAVAAYLWDFNDGNTSNVADPVYTFIDAGTYNVTLTVTDDEGLTGLASVSVTVDPVAGNQSPVAVASATPLGGELPLEVTFTGSNSTDDVAVAAYLWDFGDGNTSNVADPVYTFTDAGTYLVSLTVTDDEGLDDQATVSIEVTVDLPPALALSPDPMDFGGLSINGPTAFLDLDAFNDGGTGENISITAINITGTDAAMFGHNAALPMNVDPQTSVLIPISFTPDALVGTKSASLEIVHSGDNSPMTVPLGAVLSDPTVFEPLVRISVGGNAIVAATDGGPDWESNPANGAYAGTSYSVNSGNNVNSNFQYANRHGSIPAYIDQATFGALFQRERYDVSAAPEMEFTVPLPNGVYTVNIFLGNSFSGTDQIGERVFDILLEGNIVQDNMDMIAAFGHQAAAMVSYPVTVNDGELNIAFGHEIENPLLNAIEIIGGAGNQPPVAIVSATPLTGELPLEVTFTGSNSTDDVAVAAYLWDFGDGNTSNVADSVHTFTNAGSYLVSLTVTDDEGLDDQATVSIEVTVDLPPTLALSPNPIDFGGLTINGPTAFLDLDAFNNGGTGDNINITAINITGTDAAMFGHGATLPLNVDPQTSQLIPISFTPDAILGTKSASLEIVHSGDNSPMTISLNAEVIDYPPLTLDPISDQFNQVGQMSVLVAAATGGDPNENVTYALLNQPSGLSIEPTNGQIIGTIDSAALTGGPNNDGIHLVTVTASKTGSVDATQQFTWTITSDSTTIWVDKVEDETYTARHECSFVQAGDKFYLFGGRENATTLDIYDYTTDTWNSLSNSAPIEFNHFQAVEFQGLIWVIGAFKTNVFPIEIPADYIWAYNPATSEWIQGPEIPAARKRGSTGLVVYNNKFYVVAGNTIGHDGGYVPWFDEYDPATGIWTPLTDAPRPRDHFHAAVINGKLYAASGRLSGGDGGVFGPVISEVDVYDFSTSTWSTLPSTQNIPTPRAAAVVANFENKLVVAGGESLVSTNAFATTEIYDPATQSWTTGPDLVHQRHGTQGIVSGNGIFVTAGSPNRGGGNQKNMEYYGADNPMGSPSVVSTITTDTTIDFAIGETKNTIFNVSGGNVGVIVKSLQLSGVDAAEFSIDLGNLTNGLLSSNSQHIVTLSHIGTEDNKSAVLTINYDGTGTQTIDLSVGTGANQAPTAVASAIPLSGEVPLEVTFTGSNSTDNSAIVGYAWDFKDGNTSNVADPVHTFTSEGAYDVTLTVTNDQGLTDLTTVSITVDPVVVNQSPVAIASATPLTGELPLEVTFTGSNSTDDSTIVGYAWDFQDGNTSNVADPVYTFISEGTYNVTLTVTDDQGLTDLTTVSITVDPVAGNQPPIAVASATPLSGQIPLEVTFTGSNSTDDSAIVGYAWDFNDGNTSTLADPVHTFASDGTYTVTLTVEDSEGLQDSTSIVITVNDNSNQGVVSFTLIDANTDIDLFNIVEGMQIDINDIQGIGLNIRANTNPSVVGSVSLSISGPVNTTRNENSAPYALFGDSGGNYNGQALPLGNYILNASAYSASNLGGTSLGGLSIQFSIEENINGTNQPPVAIASAAPLSGEVPLEVTFTGSNSTDDVAVAAYLWDFNDGNTSNVADPVYTFIDAGTYNVTLTVTDDQGLTGLASVSVTVDPVAGNQSPVAVASATPLGGELPLEVTFTGSNSTDDVAVAAYLWDFGDGNTSNVADPVYTFTDAGTYLVSLTVTDDEGLDDQATVSIEVTVDLPPALALSPDPMDFGGLSINGLTAFLDLDAFNDGGTGENISITAINITGTDAAMFGHNAALPMNVDPQTSVLIPISFTPDALVGTKSASLEIVHSGDNSPMTVPLGAVLSDPTVFEPLVRISVGGNAIVAATDGGPDWESNPANGAYAGTSYSVNSGNNVNSNFQYANRHGSIPAYIDQATFGALFQRERYDVSAAPEMEFAVPLTNGDYTVNIFLGNSFSGTDQIGERVFDILLEGNIVQDNMDMVAAFGHKVAAMVSYPVTVNDGELNIAFGHEIENPLLNAIEIIGAQSSGSSSSKVADSFSTDPTTPISENKKEEVSQTIDLDIIISPNPAAEVAKLTINSSSVFISKVYLHTLDGRLIRTFDYEGAGGNSYEIPLLGLEAGLYVVNIRPSNGKMIRKKLVVKP